MPARRKRRAAPAAASDGLRWGWISALGVVTIVAYGVAYYSFGALIDPIRHSTDWSTTALGASFSAVLVIGGIGGLFGGRLVDQLGTRPAFSVAGTVGPGAIAAASLCAALPAFAGLYALGAGAISALGFYLVTQPAAIRTAPEQPQRAVVRLTIFGAFASPIFLPLTAWLVQELGWRGTLRIQALLTACVFLLAATARDIAPGASEPRREPSHQARGASHCVANPGRPPLGARVDDQRCRNRRHPRLPSPDHGRRRPTSRRRGERRWAPRLCTDRRETPALATAYQVGNEANDHRQHSQSRSPESCSYS